VKIAEVAKQRVETNQVQPVVERPEFDVIVVGAGAAGAAAAYYLTRAGLEVLVLEKARLPRYKACGGAIPRSALDRFPFNFDDVILAAPANARFTSPGLPAVDVPLPDRPVVMVMRSDFDAFLLARSEAEVLEGVAVTSVTESDDRVQVEAGGRQLTARYLVGADGAASLVARSLGLHQSRPMGGTLEAEVPLNGTGSLREEYGDRVLFSLDAIGWGYAWIFPKDDCLSVGIGRFRPGRVDLRTALQREMARLGVSLDSVQFHGHPLPYYLAPPWPFWRGQPQKRLSTRRCLLVGDAAGLVDPFVGEGIRHAISSAHLAAAAITNNDLTDYEEAIWQEIGHSLATAGLVANIYYRFPRLCYHIGVQNPAVINHIVDVLTGRVSYEGSGRRLIGATVHWLLQGRKVKRIQASGARTV
jgi:geranylgeranyl reductase family protein